MKNPWFVLIVITVVLFGGAIMYSQNASKASNEGVRVDEHVKGNPDAAVTLTEYGDFQCPACGAIEPVVQEVLAQYKDNIRFEYKHYPLSMHPFAIQAAMAAEAAAQQNKFFEYHDKLFANQQAWSNSQNPQIFFLQYASELGLDMDQFKRQQKSSVIREAIMADKKEAEDLGLTGTPTFFLNGERMQIESYEEFINQIAAAVDPTTTTVGGSSTSTTTPSATTAEPDIKFGI